MPQFPPVVRSVKCQAGTTPKTIFNPQKSLLLAALPRLLMREHHADGADLSTTRHRSPGERATQRSHTLYVLIASLLVIFLMPSIATRKLRVPQPGNPFRKNSLRRSEAIGARPVMTHRYEADLQLLSDHGKGIFARGQQQWLQAVKLLCLDSSKNANPTYVCGGNTLTGSTT